MPRSNAIYSQRIKHWRSYTRQFRRVALTEERSEEFISNCLAYARRLIISGFPVIYDQLHLSKLVGVDQEYLRAVSNCAEPFYHCYAIGKRSGSPRDISAPMPTLMAVQRWMLDNILINIPATAYSKAYGDGCSIRDNARFHLRQKVVLLVDIADFFPSIKLKHVNRLFRDIGYRKDVAAMLSGIATLKGCLPQGAPTSPHIANLVCRRIDARIAGFCIPRKIRFTRYADDIAISGDFDPAALIPFICKVLGDEGFSMATRKTRVRYPHQRQCVTGVIVNSHRQVDRSVRRRLRQEAYYISRYGLVDHMQHCGINQSNYRQHLGGKANHVRFINPADRDACTTLRVLQSIAHEHSDYGTDDDTQG